MATIKLFADELGESALPQVCLRCGATATVVNHKRFSWGPGWVMILLTLGVLVSGPLFLVALILIPILLRTKRVGVPLCGRHRNHWLPLSVVLYGGLAVLVLMVCSAIALLWVTKGASELGGWLVISALLFLFCLLLTGAILQVNTIRAVEITRDSITLTGVSKDFVRALKRKRRQDELDDLPEVLPADTRSEQIKRPPGWKESEH